jgi:long-chain acyl-CoA synthetase
LKIINYIFSDAGIKLIFVSDEGLLKKSTEASKGLNSVEAIYTFDQIAGAKHWTEILDLANGNDVDTLEPYKAAVQPEDLLTLIYTSGTTGKPKGVMLTHNNIISNVEGLIKGKHLELEEGDRALSFLPLCHIYERTDVYVYLRYGVSIYYAESMDTIADNLKEVKATCFCNSSKIIGKSI